MSNSIRVQNVLVNRSTVQSVLFNQVKSGNILCSSRGLPKFKLVLSASGDEYSVVKGKVNVSAKDPAKAFAKAVKALWN